MALCLNTPQHHKSKEIEENLQRQGSHRDDAEQLGDGLGWNSVLKVAALINLGLFTFFCSSVKSGILVFITGYCEQGEYLLSTFNFSQLLYRVMTLCVFGRLHTFLHSLTYMKVHLVVMSAAFVVGIGLWIR